MIRIADYDFLTDAITLPFHFGEKAIFTLNYKGFRCHVDMFGTPELEKMGPPLEEMKASGFTKALTISYPVARKMPRISFRQGYICYSLRHYKRLFIDSNGNFEDYLTRFKSKTISTIRRKTKKVCNSCESGSFFKVFTTPDEISEFIEIARGISRKTYQYRLLNQGLQDNEKYMEDYLLKAGNQKIAGMILYAEDSPVAYNLCPIYGDGAMIYYYTGFDPDYSKYSPGTVLQYQTIQAAFELDQVKYYDFCSGEGQHKEMFANNSKYCADIIYLPVNPKYLFVIFFKVIYDSVMDLVKFLISRFGGTAKIKKMIRSNARKKN